MQIPVNENRTITSDVGWRTEDEETPQASMSFQPTYDGYTLTGDGNTLHVKAEMNFSLDENSGAAIKAYEFGFSDVTRFLESVLDNAVYHASASRSALDAYTLQADLRDAIERRVEKTISGIDSDLRIKINSLTLDVTVPLDVKPAFDAFLKVQQESQQKVATAKADAVSSKAERAWTSQGHRGRRRNGGQHACSPPCRPRPRRSPSNGLITRKTPSSSSSAWLPRPCSGCSPMPSMSFISPAARRAFG